MSGGVFAVSRNIFEHEFFANEPFTEREAWIWLIREAAWKDRRARVGKTLVSLKRGQCSFSMRFLADAWSWSKSRVHRFLARLESEAMIGTETGQGVCVVTICNYDEYQRVSLPKSSEDGTAAGQQRDSSGTNENTGENIRNNTPSGATPDLSVNAEKEVYRFGRQVLGKSAGGVITNLRKKCEYDDAYALRWLEQAGEKDSPIEWINAVIRSADLLPYRGVEGAAQPQASFKTKAEREHEAWLTEYMRGVL